MSSSLARYVGSLPVPGQLRFPLDAAALDIAYRFEAVVLHHSYVVWPDPSQYQLLEELIHRGNEPLVVLEAFNEPRHLVRRRA
jgi:hypothetical protein